MQKQTKIITKPIHDNELKIIQEYILDPKIIKSKRKGNMFNVLLSSQHHMCIWTLITRERKQE